MYDTVTDDPEREVCLLESPPDTPMYAENFMLAWYDPAADVGAWLHLGTWPEDFTLWEDVVLLSLPGGDDVLTTIGYRHTPPAERPAGPQLAFRCIEPFRRWSVAFDGVATRNPRHELSHGLARDQRRQRLQLDLDIECVTPVWDARRSSSTAQGRGSMDEQVWASDHYQQLLRISGTITTDGTTHPIATTGVRDHSRGQRGHAMDQWGGHALIHLLFPSGRAVGIQQMYDLAGTPTFDMAYVLDGDTWYDAEIVEAPRLASADDKGEAMTLVVRTELGTHRLEGSLVASWPVTPHGLCMGVGADPDGAYGVFMPGHARWVWDGEETFGLTERSFGAGGPRR